MGEGEGGETEDISRFYERKIDRIHQHNPPYAAAIWHGCKAAGLVHARCNLACETCEEELIYRGHPRA